LKLIHLSDLHIGKSTNLEKTTRLVDWILDNRSSHHAGIVVISGDVVDDGQTWQFRKAAEQIVRLKAAGYTVLVVPGNHDYGPQGVMESFHSQAEFRVLISGIEEYPHLHLTKGQAFVLLDTMEAEIRHKEPWGAQGCLGSGQLQKLDLILDELGFNPVVENVVLVMHHHPFDYMLYHGLRDHEDLKGVISRRVDEPSRVNVLLFGHKHREHRFNDPEENKEELYGIDLIYASGQTVERDREGNMTLPVIDLEKKTIRRFHVN
jgi:3',5'-cyclic AMP phosphodiesterase CpdA